MKTCSFASAWLSPSRPHTASRGGAIFSDASSLKQTSTAYNVLNNFFHRCLILGLAAQSNVFQRQAVETKYTYNVLNIVFHRCAQSWLRQAVVMKL